MNVYLVDGNSYFYRAFHAIKNLTNADGFPTNAIYGFTTMLLKIMKDRKPEAIAIALDSKELTERHHLYEQYKAQRPQMPDSLIVQIPRIKEVIEAFRIPMFQMPGYEADDIIATIACRCAEQSAHVFILTADKDMMQVVSERIKIYDPVKDAIIDESYVTERFGVPPDRVPEVMALMGDAVDNITGVKCIGE
jgi:DNA polymerase-1